MKRADIVPRHGRCRISNGFIFFGQISLYESYSKFYVFLCFIGSTENYQRSLRKINKDLKEENTCLKQEIKGVVVKPTESSLIQAF